MVKRFLPRTLLGRSLMIMVTPLVILQLVTAYVFYDRHWQTMTRRLASSIAGEISMIIEHMRSFPEQEAWTLATAYGHYGLEVTVRKGEKLAEVPPPRGSLILDPVLREALASSLRRPFHIDTGTYEDKVEINVQLNDGVLHVLAPRKRLWSITTYIFIMWMVGTSIILFAIATIFMRNQVRPIRRLGADAEQFGKGRDVPDFKPSGALEVRQAATAFNIMRQRIQRQLRQRTEMLAGVSHDLRTPLTRMKLELAMLENSADVDALKADVEDMQRMVEGYLTLPAAKATSRRSKSTCPIYWTRSCRARGASTSRSPWRRPVISPFPSAPTRSSGVSQTWSRMPPPTAHRSRYMRDGAAAPSRSMWTTTDRASPVIAGDRYSARSFVWTRRAARILAAWGWV